QLVDLLEGALEVERGAAGGHVAQIGDLEVVGRGGRELGILQVHATNPKSLGPQPPREVTADEPTGAQNQRRALVGSGLRRLVAGCRPLGVSVSGAQPWTVPFMACRVEQMGTHQASDGEAFRSSKSGPSCRQKVCDPV